MKRTKTILKIGQVVLCVFALNFISCNSNARNEVVLEDDAEVLELEDDEMMKKAEAERIAKEKEEKERLEAELKNRWTGATSIDELNNKIKDTWWHCIGAEAIAYKFYFSNNGTVIKYSTIPSRTTEWKSHTFSCYNIEQKRTPSGQAYASIQMCEDNDEKVENSGFSINFIDHGTYVVLCQFGNRIGTMKFGDFEFSDEI